MNISIKKRAIMNQDNNNHNQKGFKQIKLFKMMVWLALCAYLIIILGSFAAVFNDNHQDTPTAFDSTSSTYNSETAVAISALFHTYSYEIGYVKHIKAYLLIYLLLLIGFYLFAFWSAIRFLGTFDTPGFRITNKTAKYLENLSGSLVFIPECCSCANPIPVSYNKKIQNPRCREI